MKKILAALAATLVLALSGVAQADPVTQTASFGSWYSGEGNFTPEQLGSVTFASGTNDVTNLNANINMNDQGYDNCCLETAYLVLADNGNTIWSGYVGTANHTNDQLFTYSAGPTDLAAIDTALGTVNWSLAPSVTLSFDAFPVGYPEWTMTVEGGNFSVTSDAVPAPGALALLGFGLFGAGAFRRKKAA